MNAIPAEPHAISSIDRSLNTKIMTLVVLCDSLVVVRDYCVDIRKLEMLEFSWRFYVWLQGMNLQTSLSFATQSLLPLPFDPS